MHIVVVGLSHRTAPVEVREKLSIPDQFISESLKTLIDYSDILEVSILSTCNRLEIYALVKEINICLLYTSPSPRDVEESRMPSSA